MVTGHSHMSKLTGSYRIGDFVAAHWHDIDHTVCFGRVSSLMPTSLCSLCESEGLKALSAQEEASYMIRYDWEEQHSALEPFKAQENCPSISELF